MPGTLMRKKPILSFHAGGHAPVHHSLIYHVRVGGEHLTFHKEPNALLKIQHSLRHYLHSSRNLYFTAEHGKI